MLKAKCVEPDLAAESEISDKIPSAHEEQKQAPQNSMWFGIDFNDLHSKMTISVANIFQILGLIFLATLFAYMA